MGHIAIGTELDLRRVHRRFRRSPWYPASVLVVLSAALAVAGSAFALADGVLFRSLPFQVPKQLHLVRPDSRTQPLERPPAVDGRLIAAWENAAPDLRLTAINVAPRLFLKLEGRNYFMAGIDEHFFEVLGVRPMLGGFTPDDYHPRPDALIPALISHRLWRTMFGQDASIVGRDVVLVETSDDRMGVRVAGVLGPDFVFPLEPREAAPDVLTPVPRRAMRTNARRHLQVIARVPQHESRVGLEERLGLATIDVVSKSGAPGVSQLDRLRLLPLDEYLGSSARSALLFLAGGAALLLLLVCMNLGALTASRQLEREQDMATERQLGASEWTVARGVLIELSVLALGAAACAVAAMPWLLRWSTAMLPADVGYLKLPMVDRRALVVVLITGLGAAATTATAAVWTDLRSKGRTVPGLTRPGARDWWARVTQAAIGVTLIAAGMLYSASFLNAWRADTAFDRAGVAVVEVLVTKVLDPVDPSRRLTAALDALSRVSGGRVVAAADPGLFGNAPQTPSRLVPAGATQPIEDIRVRLVTREFFSLARLSLQDGSWPPLDDWRDRPTVALVSEKAARALWPGKSAVGQTLVPLRPFVHAQGPLTVIGVVADRRFEALDTEPVGTIFIPHPFAHGASGAVLLAQIDGIGADVLPVLTRAVAGVDGIRVARAATVEQILLNSVGHRALPAWLFGLFGMLAVAVVITGIAGAVAMSVARSRHEIGVRLALGATPVRVVSAILSRHLSAVWMGVAVGFLLFWWLGNYLEAHLYGLSAVEPSLWAALIVLLTVATSAATVLPALKILRIDTSAVLKEG